jgi:hypothetical protein
VIEQELKAEAFQQLAQSASVFLLSVVRSLGVV